jgi:tetratricopeptide (TPR) repeat protein
MLELDPRYRVARLGLARVYIDKGRREEARAELREVEAQAGDHLPTRITIGHMAVYLGRPEEARRLLEELLRLSKTKTRYVSPVDVAVLYSQLGDRDRAFEWLERAYAERTPMLTRIGVFRAFQPLRGDPRYRDLLRRMNLPA